MSLKKIKKLLSELGRFSEYINRTSLKTKIIPKIRGGGKTRPWRYLINLASDFNYHLENPKNILENCDDEEKINLFKNIDKKLMVEFNYLITPLKKVFDQLESSNKPCINHAVPLYFLTEKKIEEALSVSKNPEILKFGKELL